MAWDQTGWNGRPAYRRLLIWMSLPWFAVLLFSLVHPDGNVKGDSTTYITLANNLKDRFVFSDSAAPPYQPETTRVPGYPLFLSFFYFFSCAPFPWIITTQICIGFLSLVLLANPMSHVSDSSATKVALFVGAWDLVYVLHMPWLIAESLLMFFLTLAFISVWHDTNNPTLLSCARSGLLLSLTLMIKPVTILLPFLLALVYVRTKKLLLFFLTFSYLLPVAWCYRNFKAVGHFELSSQGGYDLLRYPASSVQAMITGKSREEAEWELRESIDKTHGKEWTDFSERSKQYGRVALHIMKRHPFLTLKFHVEGVIRILAGTGLENVVALVIPDNSFFAVDKTYKANMTGAGTRALLKTYPILIPLFIVYLLELGILYCLFVFGVYTLWKKGLCSKAFLLFSGPIYFLIVSSHQGYYRYRIPLLPFLIVGASVGLSQMRLWLSHNRS